LDREVLRRRLDADGAQRVGLQPGLIGWVCGYLLAQGLGQHPAERRELGRTAPGVSWTPSSTAAP
jgi:hypothetical protein